MHQIRFQKHGFFSTEISKVRSLK